MMATDINLLDTEFLSERQLVVTPAVYQRLDDLLYIYICIVVTGLMTEFL